MRERSQPYKPGQKAPFKVSRSKIELYTQCPRCFWLDVRCKITRPSSPPFNINKTIDELFKKEFDVHRAAGTPHPIMIKNKVAAKPFQHEKIDVWRHNFTGVSTLHEPTNLHVFGAVDDVWVNQSDELIVVDYKATSKDKPVSIDSGWQISYKRQMEVYQWLLRANNFTVSNTGYFVYTNARMDADGFEDHLDFTTLLLPYTGDASWIDKTLHEMKTCMEGDMPAVGDSIMGGECEHCAYARARTSLTLEAIQNMKEKSKD